MNKPTYLEQAILDLSKTLMYEFHRKSMNPNYGSKLKLCYMDTGSFVCEINRRFLQRHCKRYKDPNRYSRDDNTPLTIGKSKKI